MSDLNKGEQLDALLKESKKQTAFLSEMRNLLVLIYMHLTEKK